jgi:PGF-pre-PGF domain-containing protein
MDWLTHGFPRGAMFLAYPEGAYNSTVMAAVQANHYVAARTIDPPDANYLNYDLTSPDVYMLKAYEIIGGIGPDTDNDITVINQINNTIAANGLLILAFHKIVDNLSSDAVNASTEFTTSDFHNVSDYLKESNVSVMTMSEYFGNPAPIYTPTPTPVVTATPDNTTNTTTPTPTPTPAINETANVTVTATVTPNATVVPTPVPKGSSGSSGSSSGSSSGGGGGGGGGTSGENFSNIIVKERYDKDIYINKVTQYAFTRSENPIIYVNITGNVNAGEVNTAVEVLRDTSSFVKDPAPGKVNVNVNIWVGLSGFANPNNIKEAVIRFRVENSWFSSNNIKNSSIKMVRWDGGKWNPLETSEKSKDNKYTYFEAKTNAFSPFAITGVEEAASSTMPQVIAQPGVTGTAIPNSAVTGEAPSEGAPSINFAIIIAVFAMIGIVIAVHLKRRGNF